MDENTRKTEWDGIVQKCPNCGAALSSMAAFCPECGLELAERVGSNTVFDFHYTIGRMESDLVFGSYWDDETQTCKTIERNELRKRLVSHISSFQIPNTVEDISELFLFAIGKYQLNMANAFSDKGSTMICDAWRIMVDRCYSKAKMSFDGTKEFTKIARLYKKIKKAEKRVNRQGWILILITTLIAVGVGFGLNFIFGNLFGMIGERFGIIGGRIIGIIGGLLVWYPIGRFMIKVFWPAPILH